MIEDASAWTVYWSKNTPQSCIASQQAGDKEAIDALWSNFASNLKPNATILDLATGNGAVPAAMLAHDFNHDITAVDQASIDPVRFLSEPGLLEQVEFMGGINIERLPFNDASYDALSSQFGIEYAALSAVALECARVLNPNGVFQFLMHHCQSEVIGPNALLILELEIILEKDGLLETIHGFTRGQSSSEQVELSGQQYLDNENRKTKQISGQLFDAIDFILQTANQDMTQAQALLDDLTTKLQAELARLIQMQGSALNLDGIQDFIQQLRNAGLAVQDAEAFTIKKDENEVTVGWLLQGKKPAKGGKPW